MTSQLKAPSTPDLVPTNQRPLRVTCPTCRAAVGEPCKKTRNVQQGGPNHLTRADKLFKKQWQHEGKHCARNWLMASGRAIPVEWMVYQSTGVTEAQMRSQLAALEANGLAVETADGWLWVDA